MMMVAAMAGMYMQMAMGGMAMMSGKALIIAKIALALAAVCLLKKSGGGGGGGDHQVGYSGLRGGATSTAAAAAPRPLGPMGPPRPQPQRAPQPRRIRAIHSYVDDGRKQCRPSRSSHTGEENTFFSFLSPARLS